MSQSGSCSDAGATSPAVTAGAIVSVWSASASSVVGVFVGVGLFLIQSGIPSSESVVVGVGTMTAGSGVLISNRGDIDSIGCAIGVDSIFGISFSTLDGTLSQSGTVSVVTGARDIACVSIMVGVIFVSGSTI